MLPATARHPEVVLRQTTGQYDAGLELPAVDADETFPVSTPLVAQGRVRASVIGNVYDEDESAYSEGTSTNSQRTNVAPTSFSQPQPGERNFRDSLTHSAAYPATLHSHRTTAVPVPDPSLPSTIDDFPQVPRPPRNAVISNTRPVTTGQVSPEEVSPLLNQGRASPHSASMVSPVDRDPIRRALAAITDDRSRQNANRQSPISMDPRPAVHPVAAASLSPHQYRVAMPLNPAAAFPSPYGQIPEPTVSSSPRPSPVEEEDEVQEAVYGRDTLVYVDATHSHLPPLTYRPPILRSSRLFLFILLVAAYTAALIYSALRSSRNSTLWRYVAFGDARYFVFQYLPTIISMAILLWLFEIEIALYRVAPFIALASDQHRSRSRASLLPIYPSGFLLPTLSHSAAGQHTISFFLLTSWLALATIPLVSSAFNVYNRNDEWYWLATQAIIWTAIALYCCLILATILLILYLRRRQTGLRWDPRSLADVLTLIANSNLLTSYASYAENASSGDFRAEIEARGDRLGYWCLSHSNQNDLANVFHTLGAPTLSQVPTSPGFSKTQIKAIKSRSATLSSSARRARFSHDPRAFNGHSKMSYSSTTAGDDIAVDEYLPWFLRPLATLLWAFLAFGLFVAFVVVSYLPATAIRKGFLPQLSVPINKDGYGSANFLWSFVPALLGLLCFLFWYSIDLNLRRLQLYASLSLPDGEEANKSILQEHVASGLGLVTFRAFRLRHVRVALVSATTLIATSLPILAGGIFWTQFFIDTQSLRVSGQMPAFYALTGLVGVYAAAYLFLLPKTARGAQAYSIPNPVVFQDGMTNRGRSLIDLIALTHHSKMLLDPAIRHAQSHVLMSTKLRAPYADLKRPSPSGRRPMISSPIADEESPVNPTLAPGVGEVKALGRSAELFEPVRYGIGTFIGVGGVDRWGIDRVKRNGVVVMSVRCP